MCYQTTSRFSWGALGKAIYNLHTWAPPLESSVFTLESGPGKGLLQAPQVFTVHKIKEKGVLQIVALEG